MRTLIHISVLALLALAVACGHPNGDAERLSALGVTLSGNVLSTSVAIASASAGTGLADPLAADSPGTDFALRAQPDVPRTVWVAFESGWPPSVLVQVCGTDSVGAICEFIYPGGRLVGGVVPFWSLTSIRRWGMGTSSAKASVGPGPGLGLAALRQKVDSLSFDIAQGLTGAAVVEPATILQGAGDPAVVPASVPDGNRWYEVYATLK